MNANIANQVQPWTHHYGIFSDAHTSNLTLILTIGMDVLVPDDVVTAFQSQNSAYMG